MHSPKYIYFDGSNAYLSLSGVHLAQFLVFSVVISFTIACLFDLFWSLFCLFIFDFSFWLLLWWSNFSWYLKNYINSWWRQYYMV